MKPAVEKYASALSEIVFNDPKLWTASVYSNFTGSRYKVKDFAIQESYMARQLMLKQLTSPVKWETIVGRMTQRGRGSEYPTYYELGLGISLKRILRLINNQAALRCFKLKPLVNTMERVNENEIEKVAI